MKAFQKLLALAVAIAAGVAWGDYVVNVHINGAAQPSLSFGEASQAKVFPAPPVSVAFGVADVVIDHALASGESQWYTRLSEDIRPATRAAVTSSKWLILANTKSRLTFKAGDGDIPNGLRLAYVDAKGNLKSEALDSLPDEGLTVSVAAGTQITVGLLSAADPSGDLLEPANSEALIARKDKTTKIYEGTREIPASLLAGGKFYLDIVKGQATVAVPGDADASTADWLLEVTGADASYKWLNSSHDSLEVTVAGTRTAVEMKVTSQKGSAKPIITYAKTSADGDVSLALAYILQKLGTMDVDGDVTVTGDDVMYLYWFVSAGCPGTDDDWFTADDLTAYTEGVGKPVDALANMRDSVDDFNFDDDANGVTGDDVMYLYWFVSAGCPGVEDDWFTADDLTAYTEGIGDPAKALENLRDMAE